jgi:hypothetical protein
MDTRFSKNELRFGRIRMFRAATVPQMDDGRNGDIAIIDTSDAADVDPANIGLWIKVPLTDQRVPIGTITTGTPGATNSTDTIVINSITVTLSEPTNPQQISDDINSAGITDIYSIALGDAIQLRNTANGAITVGDNTLGLSSIGALSTLVTNGVWLPFRIDATGDYYIRSAQLYIETPTEKTYPVLQLAVFPFNIQRLVAQTDSGSIDVTIEISGNPITGLTNVPVTSVSTMTNRTGSDNQVQVGDSLTVVTTNNSSATDLSLVIIFEYRN